MPIDYPPAEDVSVTVERTPREPLAQQTDVVAGIIVILLCGISGVLWAVVWWLLAPRLHVLITGEDATIVEEHPEQYLGSDVTFLFVMLGAAILLTTVIWWRGRQWWGPVMVIAVGIGVLAAALVTWKIGEEIGTWEIDRLRDLAETVKGTDETSTKSYPVLKLGLRSFLFLPALLATSIYMLLIAWSSESDSEYDRNNSL